MTKSPRTANLLQLATVLLLLVSPMPAALGLELRATRESPTDLAITGGLSGVPAGEERFVSWADLHALPLHELKLPAEFFPGEQQVTVVFLQDLVKALPVAVGMDTVLATCRDGYASVYRFDFMAECRPFVVLEINGLGSEKWPPPGLKFNPAPYVISVSATVAPAVSALLDPGHKKPWSVVSVELARFGDTFHDALSGKWANLSRRGDQGREIWINSCASCHAGPGKIFGGAKSGQPFMVLETLARCEPAFFKLYVRNPKAANPSGHMEAHPHYSDDQLDALIAFVTAEPKP
jgi:hypothetical protein